MSVAAALALSLLAPQQGPSTHDQALTCTGVFVYVYASMAQTAESDPSAENTETAAAAGRLLKAADEDRLAAAGREGIAVTASGERLQAWLEANLADPEGVIGRELDGCLNRYMDAI